MVTLPTQAVISSITFGSRQSPFSSNIVSQSSVSASTGVATDAAAGDFVGDGDADSFLAVVSLLLLFVGLFSMGSVISSTSDLKVCLIIRRLLRLISYKSEHQKTRPF